MSATQKRLVKNLVTSPGGGRPLAGKTVSIRLNTASFVDGGQREVEQSAYAITDDTGLWSAELELTSGVDPADSYYTVQELPGVIWSFQVPDGSGDLWLHDVLVDAPTNPTPIIIGGITISSPDDSIIVGGTDTAPTVEVNPSGIVQSVNGHTGTVVLAASDVGADTAGAATAAQAAAISAAATNATSASKSADTIVDGTTNKVLTATDKTRLANTSGTNTGDQTTISGNAGTASKLQTARLIAGQSFDGSADITPRLDQLAVPTADVSLNTHKLTSVGTPTVATDGANKAYVDAAAAGIDWKASVRVASTANGALATAYANGQTVDGATLVTGDRILLKDQTTGADNGIYTVNATGAPTRALDADTSAEVNSGLAVFVEEGTTNADTGWLLTTNAPITVGTTALVFIQFTGLGEVTVTADITKTGNQLGLANAGAGAGSSGDASHTPVVTLDAKGRVTVITPTLIAITADQTSNGTTNKVYTAAEQTKLAGMTALADPTGTTINGATAKTTLVDADTMPLSDSAASGALKKITWANIKAVLKTYFDTLYAAITGAVPATVVVGTGVGATDRAAINAAFTAMQLSGKATGRLVLKGLIALDVGVVFDGGYTDVCDTAYNTDIGRRFILDGSQAAITPASAVNQAFIVKGFYQPKVDLNFVEGGGVTAFTDAAMTIGSNLLTTTTTNMTGWAGRSVIVVGADPQSGYLVSVVDTVVDLHNVHLRRQANATVSAATAQSCPVGLHFENLLGPKIKIRGNVFGGCLLHSDRTKSDGTGDNTLRVMGAEYDVFSQDCTMAVSLSILEADHTFKNMWISVNDNVVIQPGLIGTHMAYCDDVSIKKYEGGCSTSGGSERVNMLFESCSDGNHGEWSLGDRDSDFLIKIVGNQTINGTVAASNFGSVNRIRLSGFAPTPSAPTINGLQLVDVDSITVMELNSFRLARAFHAVGSNYRIGQHFSMTGDANPVVIEADGYSNNFAAVHRLEVRNCYKQAVLINPTSGAWATQAHMAAGGNNPGLIRISGTIDTPNLAGAGSIYAIDQQDTGSTTVIIDVDDLTLMHRNTLQGGINHAGGNDLIRNVARARIGNLTIHGAAPTAITRPGSGVATQNATDRVLNLYFEYKLAPAASATAEVEIYAGPTAATIAHICDDYLITPAGLSGLIRQSTIYLRVPPYWYWQYTLDAANATMSAINAFYE